MFGVSACTAKGGRFGSGLGHKPGLLLELPFLPGLCRLMYLLPKSMKKRDLRSSSSWDGRTAPGVSFCARATASITVQPVYMFLVSFSLAGRTLEADYWGCTCGINTQYRVSLFYL